MSSTQRNLATSLLAGGGLLAILSQVTQVGLFAAGMREHVVTLMLFLGLALFLLGIIAVRSEQTAERLVEALAKSGKWLGIETWQVVVIFLALIFSILTHYAAGYIEKMHVPSAAWIAWLAAIALCLLGGWNRNDSSLFSKGRLLAFALAFSIVALPFRAIATGQIPIILNGDEASAGIQAIDFLKGYVDNPFSVAWYAFPSLYFFIPAASISVLGSTTEALRIPSAIAGALTVGGTYLAGHAMFGRRAGWIAALALMGFHLHIHFSRIGLNNIWDGLFFVVTVLAAWYAWEKENRNAFLLAGLGLGLSQYFYPSSRAMLIVVFGNILLSGLLDRAKLKRSLMNIGMMTFVMFVVFLPLAWYYIRFPEQYLAPLERVSILGSWMENEIQITNLPAWRILLNQMILGVQSFTYLPLQHWYRPEVALLRPLFAWLFLLGLVFLVSRPRESRSIILLLWLGMYVLLGGLSESTPAAQRYVAAAPVCILLIAHGLDESGKLIEKLWGASTRWVTIGVVGIAVLLSANDANFYFNTYTPKTVVQFGRNEGVTAQAIADHLRNKPEGTQAFFFANHLMGYYSIPSISYLAPQVQGFDVPQPWSSPENPVPTSDHLVFIFLPDNAGDLPTVQAKYPNGTLHEKIGVDGETLVWLYEVDVKP